MKLYILQKSESTKYRATPKINLLWGRVGFTATPVSLVTSQISVSTSLKWSDKFNWLHSFMLPCVRRETTNDHYCFVKCDRCMSFASFITGFLILKHPGLESRVRYIVPKRWNHSFHQFAQLSPLVVFKLSNNITCIPSTDYVRRIRRWRCRIAVNWTKYKKHRVTTPSGITTYRLWNLA